MAKKSETKPVVIYMCETCGRRTVHDIYPEGQIGEYICQECGTTVVFLLKREFGR